MKSWWTRINNYTNWTTTMNIRKKENKSRARAGCISHTTSCMDLIMPIIALQHATWRHTTPCCVRAWFLFKIIKISMKDVKIYIAMGVFSSSNADLYHFLKKGFLLLELRKFWNTNGNLRSSCMVEGTTEFRNVGGPTHQTSKHEVYNIAFLFQKLSWLKQKNPSNNTTYL